MNHQAPEQELLKIYPRSYKITALLLGLSFPLFLIIRWKNFNSADFNMSESFHLIGLFLIFIFSLLPRLIITTQRIIYKFGPFFKLELERAKIEDIYISPPAYYLRYTQGNTIWTKPLFGKTKHQNTAEYWFSNGVLFFQHTEHKKSFSRMSLNQLKLMEFSKIQIKELISTLKNHWHFEADRVELAPKDQIPDDITTQDIGKTVIILIFVAVLLGFIGFFIPVLFFKGLHFAVESYLWLIPMILMSISFSYVLIKRENKHYALLSSIFAGAFLGCCLYFLGLQTNRIYSEYHAQTISIPMTLTAIDDQSQVWTLEENLAKNIGLNEMYIHKNWQGYNTHAEQGKTYTIQIKKGLFNDYFVNQDSFLSISANTTIE